MFAMTYEREQLSCCALAKRRTTICPRLLLDRSPLLLHAPFFWDAAKQAAWDPERGSRLRNAGIGCTMTTLGSLHSTCIGEGVKATLPCSLLNCYTVTSFNFKASGNRNGSPTLVIQPMKHESTSPPPVEALPHAHQPRPFRASARHVVNVALVVRSKPSSRHLFRGGG